ncbi:MAG: APC family permease [Candidatus Acidiferrales bacterium]
MRPNCLSFWEVVAQSVANVAPVATPTLIIPLVFASSGNGTWLAYLLATVAMLLVTYHINQFARRSASPGALYTFVTHGLGPTWGVISGWSLVIAYIFTGASVLGGAANYIVVLAHLFLPSRFDLAVAAGSMLVAAGAAWWVASRDIQLSTRAMLLIEFTSVTLILILAAVYLIKSGRLVDRAQLGLAGVTPGGIRLGLVLATFSFVGFESATALGHEARDPLRSIPRSVLFSVFVAGGFFIFVSYVLTMAFHGQAVSLGESNEPLTVVARLARIPAFGIAIAAGAAMSEFACALASINAASRVIFTMSRHGLLPAAAGWAHASRSTPHVAVHVSSFIVIAAPLAMLFWRITPLNILGYLGSLATYGFLFAYVLIAVASPVYLRRRGELSAMSVGVAIAALALLAMPLVGAVYPVPAAPANYLPYIFLALLVLGTARFLYVRSRRPDMIRAIEKDLAAPGGA